MCTFPSTIIRGLNFEMEAELNKVSRDIPANFQPIPSEDVHEQTKNVHPYMHPYLFREKQKPFMRIVRLGVKSLLGTDRCRHRSITTTMSYDNLI